MGFAPGIKTAAGLLAHGQVSDFLARLGARAREGFYTAHTSFGLRRDLDRPFAAPSAKIPIEVRPLAKEDRAGLATLARQVAGTPEAQDLDWRLRVIEAEIPTCFIAIDTRTGAPCYLQWLIGETHRSVLRTLGAFPRLAPDEALLENAFTPSRYRGQGIMSAAMAGIAEQAVSLGARRVITFVDRDNVASLKGCQRSGFAPYLLREQRCFVFGLIRWTRFVALPDGYRMPHEA